MKEKTQYQVTLTEGQINAITDALEKDQLNEETIELRTQLQRVLPKSREYRVTWVTEVAATSFSQAAQLARSYQRPGTTALHFEVRDLLSEREVDIELAAEELGNIDLAALLTKAAHLLDASVPAHVTLDSIPAVVKQLHSAAEIVQKFDSEPGATRPFQPRLGATRRLAWQRVIARVLHCLVNLSSSTTSGAIASSYWQAPGDTKGGAGGCAIHDLQKLLKQLE